MSDEHVTLLSTSVQTFVHTIGNDPILSFFAIFLMGYGAYILFQRRVPPPAFDPTRHIERPPLEHKPMRQMPSPGSFVDWERQNDEKDHAPWN
jgi:hypothetical protein